MVVRVESFFAKVLKILAAGINRLRFHVCRNFRI